MSWTLLTLAQGSSGIFCVFKKLQVLTCRNALSAPRDISWLAWFPFILYDTDWMGREIYRVNPRGTKEEIEAYDKGVQRGAFGLLLNSVIKLLDVEPLTKFSPVIIFELESMKSVDTGFTLVSNDSVVVAITSMLLMPMCRKLTSGVVWIISNNVLFLGMVAITILSIYSTNGYAGGITSRPDDVKIGALVIVAVLGFPLAVIIALSAGPWDAIFGKGNIPAFALSGAIAILGGFIGLALLPKLSGNSLKSSSFGSMH